MYGAELQRFTISACRVTNRSKYACCPGAGRYREYLQALCRDEVMGEANQVGHVLQELSVAVDRLGCLFCLS